jgi:DNA helicase IV
MGGMNPPSELREFLYPYDPRVQAIGLGLRKVVLEELAPCHEYIFPMRSKVVLLYGSSERVLADCVCSIAVFRRHATLIFHHGVDLKDTHHLLQGTGKALRHIRVEHLEELDRRELRAYLREARRRSPLGTRRRSTAADVVTRIKRKPAKRDDFPRMF